MDGCVGGWVAMGGARAPPGPAAALRVCAHAGGEHAAHPARVRSLRSPTPRPRPADAGGACGGAYCGGGRRHAAAVLWLRAGVSARKPAARLRACLPIVSLLAGGVGLGVDSFLGGGSLLCHARGIAHGGATQQVGTTLPCPASRAPRPVRLPPNWAAARVYYPARCPSQRRARGCSCPRRAGRAEAVPRPLTRSRGPPPGSEQREAAVVDGRRAIVNRVPGKAQRNRAPRSGMASSNGGGWGPSRAAMVQPGQTGAGGGGGGELWGSPPSTVPLAAGGGDTLWGSSPPASMSAALAAATTTDPATLHSLLVLQQQQISATLVSLQHQQVLLSQMQQQCLETLLQTHGPAALASWCARAEGECACPMPGSTRWWVTRCTPPPLPPRAGWAHTRPRRAAACCRSRTAPAPRGCSSRLPRLQTLAPRPLAQASSCPAITALQSPAPTGAPLGAAPTASRGGPTRPPALRPRPQQTSSRRCQTTRGEPPPCHLPPPLSN